MASSLRRKITDPEFSTGAENPTRVGESLSARAFGDSTKPLVIENRPAREVREVMDIRQAAGYLGISPDSLYKYASENVIPAFKLGNRWRFKRSLLDDWMEQQSLQGYIATAEKRVKPRQKKPVSRAR